MKKESPFEGLTDSTPKYTVKEVAEMLNYASPQYFASEFKKKFGLPPKNFKLRIRS